MARIETRKLAHLATHLNGAVDSGKYGHITTDVVKREIESGDIWDFLARELGSDVDVARLNDSDRVQLLREWQASAKWYETKQFHVTRGGIPLLVAYLLHGIAIRVVVPPR